MDYRVFAQVFGLVAIFVSMGLLLNMSNAKKMARNMIATASGYIIGGLLPLLVGCLVVTQHNKWVFGWPLLITLIGWFLLVIGVFRCWFVNTWQRLMESNIDYIPSLFALFGMMLGLLLTYAGFFAHIVRL